MTTGPSAPGGVTPSGGDAPGAELTALVRTAVRDEFDEIAPHVVAALNRNRAFDELSARLSQAERRLEGRRERPLVVAVHRLLNRLRHLDFDAQVKKALEADLVTILQDVGFDETGQVGDDYDPARHVALEGRAAEGRATIAEVLAPGLACLSDVIVRAQVRIVPRADERPPAD